MNPNLPTPAAELAQLEAAWRHALQTVATARIDWWLAMPNPDPNVRRVAIRAAYAAVEALDKAETAYLTALGILTQP